MNYMNKYNVGEKVFFNLSLYGLKYTCCGKILAVKKTMFSYNYVIKVTSNNTIFYDDLVTVRERNIIGLTEEK